MCNPGGVLASGFGLGSRKEDDTDLPAGATMAERVFAALDSGAPTRGWFEPGSPMCAFHPRVAIKLRIDGAVDVCALAGGGSTTVWLSKLQLYMHGPDEDYLAYVCNFANGVRRRYLPEWSALVDAGIVQSIVPNEP